MKTIFVIGDSTVDTNTPPYYGWGGQLHPLLAEEVRVVNLAKSGASSKSFLEAGLFVPAQADMRPGDLLLAGFGHNDEKDDPALYTDPAATFPQTLMVYVDAARKAGAIPVLCTSVSRALFYGDDNQYLHYTHGEYPMAVRTLAEKEGIALIDLKRQTRALLLSMGAEDARSLYVNLAPGEDPNHPEGIEDKTHFSRKGAAIVARMVVDALVAMGLLRSDEVSLDA